MKADHCFWGCAYASRDPAEDGLPLGQELLDGAQPGPSSGLIAPIYVATMEQQQSLKAIRYGVEFCFENSAFGLHLSGTGLRHSARAWYPSCFCAWGLSVPILGSRMHNNEKPVNQNDVKSSADLRASVDCLQSREPTWTERYKLGVQLNKELEPLCTFDELAVELGVSRQNAYTETVLALGTLAWRLRQLYVPADWFDIGDLERAA